MIIKVKPDLERVKSMLRLIENREKSILVLDFKEFPTIVMESYYEIIKELCSALILLDGFKALGENAHKDLIDFLSNYPILEVEKSLIHDLRIRRNKSSYEGKMVDKSYLEEKQKKILDIIKKLKLLVKRGLKK